MAGLSHTAADRINDRTERPQHGDVTFVGSDECSAAGQPQARQSRCAAPETTIAAMSAGPEEPQGVTAEELCAGGAQPRPGARHHFESTELIPGAPEDPHITVSDEFAADPHRTIGADLPADPHRTIGEDRPADQYATVANDEVRGSVGVAASPEVIGHVGDYALLAELGRGGMGVVYKARQSRPSRVVALKMILAGGRAGATQRERFRGEAEAIARLQQPNIVQIHEVGEHDGLPFFSLEYCPGGSLAKQLAGTPQPAAATAALLETLARAMHAAHQKGVIHRDLKPANILLAEDGTPKVTDFGLAKVLGEEGLSTNGDVMGTPSYMAPEQAEGKVRELGPACDVYALGAILYECLTGRPPFRAATTMETVFQVIRAEPVAPRKLNGGVPRDLETVCLKCLQKEPARRYTSAWDLAEDLRRFQAREPVLARPVSALERLGKWARRKPAAAAAALLAVLAVAALLGSGVLFTLYRAEQAEQHLRLADERQDLQGRCSQLLLAAQRHEAAGHWDEARTELKAAAAMLDAQPELCVPEQQSEVRDRLALVLGKLQDQHDGQKARGRREEFWKAYDRALDAHTAFLTGLDRGRDNTFARARSALDLYGSAGPDGVPSLLQRDRPYLALAEPERLAGACYELLLISAEVVGAAPPGADREAAGEALALLERARRLGDAFGFASRAYHLYRDRFQALSRGETFDAAAAAAAAPKQQGRLDWFLTGLELYRQKRYADASAACDRLLAHDDDIWARYVKALALLGLRDFRAARSELTVCLALKKEFIWPRLQRGLASMEIGHALTLTKSADPAGVEAEYAAAQKDFDVALGQDGDTLVHYVGLANRGVLNIRRGRYEAAAADLRRALELRPEMVESYPSLSVAYQGLGRWDEALAVLGHALKRASDAQRPLLYECRARLHKARKDGAAARADFEQAVALAPVAAAAGPRAANLLELGALLHRESEYRRALDCYERALALYPKATALLKEVPPPSQGHGAPVPDGYRRAMQIYPALDHALWLRAQVLVALGRDREAAADLDAYLRLAPLLAKAPPADAYLQRGLIHADHGQLTEAVAMYTQALRHEPVDTSGEAHLHARRHRGWAYVFSGAAALALKDFEACLDADPNAADARIGRATARVQLQQVGAALEDARAAEGSSIQGVTELNARQLYRLARVYALAAAPAGRAVSVPPGRIDGLPSADACRRKALELIAAAVERLAPDKRASFWRGQVQADPALAVIRGDPMYPDVTARLAATGP